MNIRSKAEILEILGMPQKRYAVEVAPLARRLCFERRGGELTAVAMLGFDNICRNRCLYCGMRAGNSEIERYRLDTAHVIASAEDAAAAGFKRIFLISGEDPKYGFDNLLSIVEGLKATGLSVSLACGELSKERYAELAKAGADQYVLKFEFSQPEIFNRMKPTADFNRRMAGIGWIKESGMRLASGSIVDYPGQTDEQLAEDILFTAELGIAWAPVIPYLPAKGTPLTREGGKRGSFEKNLRVISLLRIMMPDIDITAQQPGPDPARGLSDPEGNLAALNAGANLLFADLLPAARARDFSVVDNRIALGMEHIRDMAERAGMRLAF